MDLSTGALLKAFRSMRENDEEDFHRRDSAGCRRAVTNSAYAFARPRLLALTHAAAHPLSERLSG
jgi:hypothetical protein